MDGRVAALDAALRSGRRDAAARAPPPAARLDSRRGDPFRADAAGRGLHADLRRPAGGARHAGASAGGRIWAEFRRRDGCEIDRWERVVPFLSAGCGA